VGVDLKEIIFTELAKQRE